MARHSPARAPRRRRHGGIDLIVAINPSFVPSIKVHGSEGNYGEKRTVFCIPTVNRLSRSDVRRRTELRERKELKKTINLPSNGGREA
jgi:hypothetical protein